MVNIKEECEEFATFLCMIVGAAYLFVGFSNILELVITVMTFSFALQLHLVEVIG